MRAVIANKAQRSSLTDPLLVFILCILEQSTEPLQAPIKQESVLRQLNAEES